MHIKEVGIRGFRTYRDPCVFRFCPGYNVIVGLNGSGKSNVLLAVSFALAETLEHANRSCYLYRGAESSEDDDFTAHVEVVFDVSRDVNIQSVIDNKDELRLKRIFSRSKDLYLVNGRQMSRKDYRQLIESVKLIHFSKQSASYRNDLHFIVKQGAIGKICSLSSEERLAAFRDVIGHRSFDSKIEESMKLLKDYDVTFSSVDAQLSQIQRKLDTLDIQRGASEEWSKLDAERRVLQASLVLLKLSQLRENASAQETAESELSAKINELQGRVDLLEMDVRESRGALSIIESAEEAGTANAELSSLESSLADVEAESAELRKELGLLTHTKGQLERELDTLNTSLESSVAELAGVENDHVKASRRIQDLETQLSDVMHRQHSSDEKVKELIERLEQRKSEARESIKEFESQKATLSSSLTRCMNDQELLHSEIAKLKDLCADKAARMEECTASLETSLETKRIKQNELSASAAKQSNLRVQYSDADKNFSKVALSQKTTLGLVKDWLDSDDSAPHRDSYVGVLIDLVTVSDAFKLAVEQTLGPKLFTVVVRTMKCAKSLISHIEKSESRYSNIRIVPLDIFPKSIDINDMHLPNSVDRAEAMPLMDCLTFDDHLKPLIRSLLGDFCLVENADVASRISGNRVNCVTPDGQVFYHRGSVSGGYVDMKESILRLYDIMKQAGADLAAEDEHVARLQSDLESLGEEQTKLAQQRNVFKSERASLQENLRQLQISLQHLTSLEDSIRHKLSDNSTERLLYQIKSWDEQIEVYKRAATPSPAALAELASRQSSLESELVALRRQKCTLESRAHELRDNVSVLQDKRNALAKRVITTLQLLEDYSGHLRDLEQRSASLTQSRDSIGSEILKASEEREKSQRQLDELCSRIHKLETELASQKAALAEATAQLRDTSQTLSSIKISIKESEDELSRLDQAVLEEAKQTPVYNKDDLMSRLAEINKRCSKFDLSVRGCSQDSAALRAEFKELRQRQERISRSNAAILKSIRALKSQKDSNLVQMLSQLNDKLSQTFEELVPGGRIRAVLLRRELATSEPLAHVAVCLPECFVESPDEEKFTGLDLKVSFSAGSDGMQQLYQLSGGQKTLVSLAFILAAQRLQAAPFYLLDEIDAALDEGYRVNVSRLLERQCREGSQCILTTFRYVARIDLLLCVHSPELLHPGEVFYEVCNEGGVSVAHRVGLDDAMSVISRCTLAITNGPVE
ncbi:RecF/RecN/SMC N terminal domain containing protein, putative [Babesia bigemina]|uniref:Structural maintenance of chromosomes protein n=1 Tax=Babesia bigemina TaxID=5866 RepID=A0A061DCA7_BABBI|nr:RecF/RecN/SMC N terminal domain containing protein, putative [Babesia bigemina]CDR96604.1 RecF/RecN/SMC N terminal domain containing protein, putative [Babesia bigemina]|eukprot:XP_012768790.1 RecF/RecN/SMC N terminal domain containing protein, putative [Babesia bigemina]